jgi:hypothetical protein
MSRAFAPPDTLSQDDIRTVADVRRAVWINGLFGLGAGSVTGCVTHLVLQTLQRRYVVGTDTTTATADAAQKSTSSATAGKIATPKINTNSIVYKFLKPLPPLGKNTFLLSFLGGGALGSFLMSTTAGKNAVHLLHPIFNIGRDEYAGKSPYQVVMSKAAQKGQQSSSDGTETQQQHDDATTIMNENSIAAAIEADELDITHHRKRTLRRQASIKRRLEHGHSLSDTHSNTWPTSHPATPSLHDQDTSIQLSKDKSLHRAEVWGRRQSNRKQYIKDKIESGNSLSDSHVRYSDSDQQQQQQQQHYSSTSSTSGNRADAFRRRQTDRRKLIHERIIEKRGGAISSSTGGHWVEEVDEDEDEEE